MTVPDLLTVEAKLHKAELAVIHREGGERPEWMDAPWAPEALAMPEKRLQSIVVRTVAELGGLACYTTIAQRSPFGEFDLRIILPPRVIFAELKTEKGELTPKQAEMLEALAQCRDVEKYIWRPHDWFSGEILRVLARDRLA